MLFCCFLCVRVRASSRAICLKAQLSRLAQERRYATLTAARQTLQELRVAICNARTAFPLTPLAVVAKQVYRAFLLLLREKARAARPAHRRDVSALTAPLQTPCHAFETARAPPAPPHAATLRCRARSNAHTARQNDGRQRVGKEIRNQRRRVLRDLQAKIQPARGRREGMSGAAQRWF